MHILQLSAHMKRFNNCRLMTRMAYFGSTQRETERAKNCALGCQFFGIYAPKRIELDGR